MDTASIIALVILIIATVTGAIVYAVENHEYLSKTHSRWGQAWRYIVFTVLGAAYLVIRFIVFLFRINRKDTAE